MSEPFLKWPGGKRWLVNRAGILPESFNRYLEPFLGSGAVFFHLQPAQAILSDANEELVNAYECVRKQHKKIEKQLASLQLRHSRKLYYQIRSSSPSARIDRAVRFIYLNRTCFNGIYRVNKEGRFNVPMGTKVAVEFPTQTLKAIAQALASAELVVADFETTINRATKNDFLYVDPPYTVMHNTNNFNKYNARLFRWEDQVRLSSAVKRAGNRGVRVLLSNAFHESVRRLYSDFGDHFEISRSSVLAAESRARRSTTELLITTYGLPDDCLASGQIRRVSRLKCYVADKRLPGNWDRPRI